VTDAVAPLTLTDLIPRSSHGRTRLLQDAALVGGFAVFTALLAQITIHLSFTPVPITGQTLGVLLAGAALGTGKGAASMLVYWMAGWVGLPFYADHKSGWHNGTGATMGYFVGFIAAAAVVGYLAERRQDRTFATSVPAMLAGTAIIYVFGAGWLALDLNIPLATGTTNAIALGVTPFLIGDSIKLLIAGAATPVVWKTLQKR
jgi:biotin transport system substrate-specific component